MWISSFRGFPDSSVGKESACSAGEPSSIPGSGRSAGEGIDFPPQYSWASLVAQLVKNPPAMWETWVWSLGWEDSLEKGKATHSSILAWRIPWTVQSTGSQRVGHDWVIFHFTSYILSSGKWKFKSQMSYYYTFILWLNFKKMWNCISTIWSNWNAHILLMENIKQCDHYRKVWQFLKI